MIEVRNLTKIYRPKKGVPVKALDNVSLKIEETGLVFILGKSGSGKSTLLNTLGGLDKYDDGEIIIKGKSSKNFTQSEFDSYRNTYVGFIFQEYNILDEFTVGANIALAMELQGKKADKKALNELLETVDLTGYADRKPNELSGGQKQRVAIARALIKNPEIIMADEPTGALDSNTGKQVFETLKKLSKEKLVIVVSHDREFAEYYGDRVIELADGKIISDIVKYKAPSKAASSGVSVIDDKIIHIKKGYTLTNADLAMINEQLKKAQSDIVISTDGRTNDEVKRAARIDDEGNREAFKDTDNSSLDVKAYSEGDFKTIKSRLPIKNAVKIGASSLKAKPIRLFMTILLSAVAFCMFGIVDTVSAYNKVTATVDSIKDSNITYAAFSKEEKYVSSSDYYYYSTENMNSADIKALATAVGKEESSLIKVASASVSLSYGSTSYSSNDEYYNSISTIRGFAETTEATLQSMGYTVDGNYPAKTDEIAITDVALEYLKKKGYVDPTSNNSGSSGSTTSATINGANDIIGKKLYSYNYGENNSNNYYTVTAVINTDFDSSRYDDLKDTTTSSSTSTYLLSSELSSVMYTSPYGIAYVCDGFLKANGYASENYLMIGNESYSGYKIRIGEYAGSSKYLYTVSDISSDTSVYYLGNTTKDTTLGEKDVIVDYWLINNAVNNAKEEFIENGGTFNELDACVGEAAKSYASTKYESDPSAFEEFISAQCSGNNDKDYIICQYGWYYKQQYNYRNSADKGDYATDYAGGSLSTFLTEAKTAYYNSVVNLLNADASGLQVSVSVDEDDGGDYTQETYQYNVVGFIPSDDSNTYNCYFSEAAIKAFPVTLQTNSPYSFAFCSMPTDNATLKSYAEMCYDESVDTRYVLNNSVMSSIEMVNSLMETLSQVLLYVGLAFAVFASFLMLNFIATSISYKKREIGILRAVGARGSDVFRIFFSESFIIALINWAIAIIGAFAVCIGLNSMMRNSYGIIITILSPGIRQIALVLLISVAVAAIASFFPVWKIAKKRPIDAIRSR